jgi:carbon storage regulator
VLVLSRKLGEKIYIGDNICITVVDIDRGKIRLGIECDRSITIYREELLSVEDQDRITRNLRGLGQDGKVAGTGR